MRQDQIASYVRLALLFFALQNQLLVNLGYSVIPVEEEELEQALTAIFTLLVITWNWWKQNTNRD